MLSDATVRDVTNACDRVDASTADRRVASPQSDAANGSLAPVTVVIVNHNVGAVLRDCLTSVLSQAAEVVLVDNASRPEQFKRLIADFVSQQRLHVIRSPDNLGFAGGCNLGAEISTQRLLLFLNPDCVLGAGTLARMCEAIDRHARVGMAGGRLTYPHGEEQGGGRRAIPTPWRSFVRAFGLSRFAGRWPKLFNDFHLHKQPLPAAPIAVEAISGACMLVKREAIQDFGLMDEGYFLHCEDLDLCMRARAHGWEILFVPDAQIVHHKGGCSQQRPIFVEWHKHRGMIRFYNKYFRHRYPAGLMEVVIAGVWLRFAAIAVCWQTALFWRRCRALRASTVPSRLSVNERLPLDVAVVPIVVSHRPITS